MNHSEEDMAGRIVRRLDQGLGDLDQPTLAKLRSARERATERMRQPAWRLAWAGTDATKAGLRHFNPRHLLPLAAIVLAVSGMVYWQQVQHIEDPVDIDAKLLSGDLPIDAYLDQGLDSWLKR